MQLHKGDMFLDLYRNCGSAFSMCTICIVLLCSIVTASVAQTSSDTLILPIDAYLQQVKQFHPLSQKTDLQVEMADLEKLRAKGMLDPKIDLGWAQKNFDKKLYYRNYQGKIKVPTKYGLSAVGGYENSEGIFLNPENTTDRLGLWNVGLELDVLQGLITNERSVGLELADLMLAQTIFDQEWILNSILYEAASAYLMWQQFYLFRTVLAENQSLSQTYLENTKLLFQNGEKSVIDTLEAFILLQDATNGLNENEINLTKAKIEAQNYFWEQGRSVNLQRRIRMVMVMGGRITPLAR